MMANLIKGVVVKKVRNGRIWGGIKGFVFGKKWGRVKGKVGEEEDFKVFDWSNGCIVVFFIEMENIGVKRLIWGEEVWI